MGSPVPSQGPHDPPELGWLPWLGCSGGSGEFRKTLVWYVRRTVAVFANVLGLV